MSHLPNLRPRTQRQLRQALAVHQGGNFLGALDAYARILKREPRNPLALHYGALACHQLGRNETAITMMQACVALVPDHADSWFNLGKFFRDNGDEENAGMAYAAAIEQDRAHVEALVSAGDHYWGKGDAGDARRMWRFALSLAPRTPEGRHYQSFARIRQGDAGGWADYESRWQCAAFRAGYARAEYDALPQWSQGEEPDTLAGRHLLVHGEQGLGDQIQTLRYLRWLRLYADRVTVEVLPPLLRLARSSFPWATVIARGEPLPVPVDVAVPSLSLPARFGGRFPADVPYLCAPAGERPAGGPPRVGIVWAGSKGHANDRNRSIAVEQLAPLWAVPDVEWVSLQVGDRADEAPAHLDRIDRRVTDFADTAAVVSHLDLVIAVDTSTAHLAGALGVPTWLLLPRLPDHRWELEREDTPWYPTMRLYRQPVAGAWDDALARVARDLNLLRV